MVATKHQLFCVLTLILLSDSALAEEKMSRAEVAQAVKPSTALVDVKSLGMASAFCVDASGLFITNHHVIQAVGDTQDVTLVIDAGTATQKVVKARVIRRDKDLDLALLQTQTGSNYRALELGSDNQITELSELITFGFPFGAAFSKPGEYPTITVNAVNVSSLRTDEKRELSRIQLDSDLNPGNSGGPVVDLSGKVVGVVVSGIVGRGINLAIPVRHVRRFMEKPVISLTVPTFSSKQKHDPLTFIAHVAMFASEKKELNVELVLKTAGDAERRLLMKPIDHQYKVTAIPYPPAGDGLDLPIEVKYPDGSAKGIAKDQRVHIGQDSCLLSEIRKITNGASPSVELQSGKKIEGKIDLDAIYIKIGAQKVNFQLHDAVEIICGGKVEDILLKCSVIVSAGGAEIARHDQNVYFAETERATLETVKNGKFIKPLPAASPVSYFRAISAPGETLAQGQALAFDAKQMSLSATETSLSVNGGPWNVLFVMPTGMRLSTGEYPGAKRAHINYNAPGIDFSGEGRASSEIDGHYVIWEVEVENRTVKKLAVDFILRSHKNTAPIYGMIRYNSSFE